MHVVFNSLFPAINEKKDHSSTANGFFSIFLVGLHRTYWTPVTFKLLTTYKVISSRKIMAAACALYMCATLVLPNHFMGYPQREWVGLGYAHKPPHLNQGTQLKLSSNSSYQSVKAFLGLTIDMSNNNEKGPLTFVCPTNLTHLAMSGNQISGFIASKIGMSKNLVYLDLSFNMLIGPIPSTLAI